MKKYKIGLNGTDMYLKAVVLDTTGGKLTLKAIPAFSKEEEAIYEEDKAKFYLQKLNESEDEMFFLSEVEEDESEVTNANTTN